MRSSWIIGVTGGLVAGFLIGVSVVNHKTPSPDEGSVSVTESIRTAGSCELLHDVEEFDGPLEESRAKALIAEAFYPFASEEVDEIGPLTYNEQVLAAATKKAFAQLQPDLLIGLLVQQGDFETAFAVLDAYPSVANYDEQFGAIFSGLAQENAGAAAEIFKTIKCPDLRAYTTGYLAQCWAFQDVKKGFDWLASLNEGDPGVEFAYILLMEYYVSEDPLDAARIIGLLEPGLAQATLLPEVAAELSRQDPQKALSWVADLRTRGIATDGVLDTIVQNWASGDPIAALNYVLHSDRGELRDETIGSVMENLALINTAEAARHFNSLPEGAKALSAQSLARYWMQKDSVGAYQWMADLPAGNGRDFALSEAGRYLMKEDLSQAFVWAAYIDNEKIRAELIEEAVWAWPLDKAEDLLSAIKTLPLAQNSSNELMNALSWRLRQDLPTPFIYP